MRRSDESSASIVTALLREGISRRATDLHLEPDPEGARVRYRVDGALREGDRVSREHLYGVVAEMKRMGGLDATTRRICQEGRFPYRAEGREYQLAISLVPFVEGERIVIRGLQGAPANLDLQLLLEGANRDRLLSLLNRTHGLILVSGLAGSGRTTTLMALAQHLADRGLAVASIGDAVLPGLRNVQQAEVNEEAGLTQEALLRAIANQGTDVILVGELRRGAAAQAAEAAAEGHLVLAAVHADDAVSTVPRLIDLGVPPLLASTTLLGVCCQRLASRLCPQCKEPAKPSEHTLRALGIEPAAVSGTTFYTARGCPECQGTGIAGQATLHEVLLSTEGLREQVAAGPSLAALRRCALEQGMVTFAEAARDRVLAGEISPTEAERVLAQRWA